MRSYVAPIELIQRVEEALGEICESVVFVGGSVVGLLITDPAAPPPRATEDVDVVIEISSRLEYYNLENELRIKGFVNAHSGPICRFTYSDLILDVMPTDPQILGFAN